MSVQVRSPQLFSHSCIPVYLGFWTALCTLFPSFPALLSAFFQMGNQSCAQHTQRTGFIPTWCCLVVWSVFLPQLFYLLFWSLLNTGMTFPGISLRYNLKIFSLCGNSHLTDQHMYLKLDLCIFVTALCRYLHWFKWHFVVQSFWIVRSF